MFFFFICFRRKPCKPRVPLIKLAKQKRFKAIAKILESDRYDIQQWIYDASSQTTAVSLFRGESPLHAVMHWRPPIVVVEKLIEKLRYFNDAVIPEEALDIKGRTPLHIAAAVGCEASVILRLLNGASAIMPAIIKDHEDRYPLHWACANPRGELPSNDRNGRRKKKKMSFATKQSIENMIVVILALVRAYPEGAAVRDKAGMTCKDLATRNLADQWLIQLLDRQVRKHSPSAPSDKTTEETNGSSMDDVSVPRVIADKFDMANDGVSAIGLHGASVIRPDKQSEMSSNLSPKSIQREIDTKGNSKSSGKRPKSRTNKKKEKKDKSKTDSKTRRDAIHKTGSTSRPKTTSTRKLKKKQVASCTSSETDSSSAMSKTSKSTTNSSRSKKSHSGKNRSKARKDDLSSIIKFEI